MKGVRGVKELAGVKGVTGAIAKGL